MGQLFSGFQEPSWMRRQYIRKRSGMIRKKHDILPKRQELTCAEDSPYKPRSGAVQRPPPTSSVF
jgi:hypothetical protein